LGDKNPFIMMIQEKWWSRFLQRCRQGRKIHSYVQRSAGAPKSASMIFFYVAKPVGEIAGYADFIERQVGDSDQLWKEFGKESVLETKEKYDEFVGDSPKTSFIRFKNLTEAAEPIPLNNVLLLLGLKRLSRKGFYIDNEIGNKLQTLMEGTCG